MFNIDSVCTVYGLKELGEIFISDAQCALNKDLLKQLKITHVLNAAEGEVHTGPKYYNNIIYMGIALVDLPHENISLYFDQVADFIHHCLSHRGKIVVHCAMGISRSTTCVVAYLIKYCNMNVNEALKLLRKKRAIIDPNPGFIIQLKNFQKIYGYVDD